MTCVPSDHVIFPEHCKIRGIASWQRCRKKPHIYAQFRCLRNANREAAGVKATFNAGHSSLPGYTSGLQRWLESTEKGVWCTERTLWWRCECNPWDKLGGIQFLPYQLDKGSTFKVVDRLLIGIHFALQTKQNLGESVYVVNSSFLERIEVL